VLPLTNTSNLTSPLAHIVERLGAAEVLLEPYPHYYLENVFPADYYQTLLENLPESSAYQNLYEVTDLKLDHFRHRDQRDFNQGWTGMLTGEVKEFWQRFHEWFLGPALAHAVMRSFSTQLHARFGDEQSWPEVLVESQLIRHRAGYFLGPHSDLYTKLIVLLLYLAPDDSAAHLGTSLYRPKDPAFSCPNSTHYPFEDFIRVKTASYKPNSLLAFVRSDISFHGLEVLSEKDVTTSGRDVIQYVLHDKQARQEQLRARRLASRQKVTA
jgi:hypothetical protein